MIIGLLSAVCAYLTFSILIENVFSKQIGFMEQVEKLESMSTDKTIKDELDLSFSDRIVKPLIDQMVKSISSVVPLKESTGEELQKKLQSAGLSISAKDYAATNIIVIICFGVGGFALGFALDYDLLSRLGMCILGLFAGYTLRKMEIEQKITARRKGIRKQLPEAMDILSVSIVAGLSFNQAIENLVQKSSGPLIEEFRITQRETMLGKSRILALEDLAKRCDTAEVYTFINAVTQAEQVGMSLQSVLDTQAELFRDSLKQEIEELAAKIPVKILIPMVLFIFPVIFIVLLGPAVPQIMDVLGGV